MPTIFQWQDRGGNAAYLYRNGRKDLRDCCTVPDITNIAAPNEMLKSLTREVRLRLVLFHYSVGTPAVLLHVVSRERV